MHLIYWIEREFPLCLDSQTWSQVLLRIIAKVLSTNNYYSSNLLSSSLHLVVEYILTTYLSIKFIVSYLYSSQVVRIVGTRPSCPSDFNATHVTWARLISLNPVSPTTRIYWKLGRKIPRGYIRIQGISSIYSHHVVAAIRFLNQSQSQRFR